MQRLRVSFVLATRLALAASLTVVLAPAARAQQSLAHDDGAGTLAALGPIVQEAYLKASNTDAGDQFGFTVAVSGNTVVVGAPKEASNAATINGNQSNNSVLQAGAAYVFVRNGASWTQQAYLKPSNNFLIGMQFGTSVAIDGDTIVVGALTQTNFPDPPSGAAYVFVRSGSTWSQQAFLKAPHPGLADQFGSSVAVSGNTLVVGAPLEDSGATGVNGVQLDETAPDAGAAYVFARSGAVWTVQAYLKASNTDANDYFGGAVAISGNTIVIGAQQEDGSAAGVNGDDTSDTASAAGAAYVFLRTAGVWAQQAYLKASNVEQLDGFGNAVAVSGDTVVVGAWLEDSAATGVDGDQSSNFAGTSGAAYVFARSGGMWAQQAYLKASNTQGLDFFGFSVSASGDTVLVGAKNEDSLSGAAYLYERGGATWSHVAYIKASNADGQDLFGNAVSVSEGTAVVGAPIEASAATGVNGNQADDSKPGSGAAYAFDLGDDAWTNLGGGTTGANGPPLLEMAGPLTPASVIDLDLVDGPPSKLAIILISFSSTPVPYVGGVLHAVPDDALIVVATDAAGEIHGAGGFPGAPPGTQLWFQVGMQDPSVPIYGKSLSNGVKGTVP
jgi:hypothetical protein